MLENPSAAEETTIECGRIVVVGTGRIVVDDSVQKLIGALGTGGKATIFYGAMATRGAGEDTQDCIEMFATRQTCETVLETKAAIRSSRSPL